MNTTATVDQNDHVAAAQYLMKHAGTTALAVLDGQRPGQPVGASQRLTLLRRRPAGQTRTRPGFGN